MSNSSPLPACSTVSKWNVVFTSGCNLRCGYCATRYGTFGKPSGVMDEKTAARLVDWIVGSMDPKRETRVTFSGGETFLHYDRFLALADQIAALCEEQGGPAKISVTTNGVLLNPDRLQQLAARGIALTFSIDGPEPIHDAMRQGTTGQGSFQAAFRNWTQFRDLGLSKDSPTHHSVHGVFGPHSGSVQTLCEFWKKQNQPLVDLAIINHSRFEKATDRDAVKHARTAAVAGLREWALAQAACCTPEDFLEHYRGPAVIYKGWQRLFFGTKHPLCTPGCRMLGVGHDGTLYLCEAYIGTDRWQIGNLWDGLDAKRLETFRAECRKAEEFCAACPAEPTCDKPCLGLSAEATPRENVFEGCEMSKALTALIQESFDVLMNNQKGQDRHE